VKLGGTVTAAVGWTVLAITILLSLIIGPAIGWLVGAMAGWIAGGGVAAVGIAIAVALVMGGRALQRTGDRAAFGAKRDAVFALARNQSGILRAGLVGTALGVPTAEADAFLTNLSREPDSGVTLEVDHDGKLYYRFAGIAAEAPWPPPGVRLAPANGASGVRVARTEIGVPGAADAALEDEPEADEAEAKRAKGRL
jgi:hypothetical protein